MIEIIYTTPDTYDENNPLDKEILTGQVAYLLKDNGDGTGLFSVRSREDGERFEKLLSFSYVMRHQVEFPHPRDTEQCREHNDKYKGHMHLTVGELRKYLEEHKDDLDDDGIVYYQRIEDVYFEKHGWNSTSRIKYWDMSFTQDGDYNPLQAAESEFVSAFCCYGYFSKHPKNKQRDRNLYITAHY